MRMVEQVMGLAQLLSEKESFSRQPQHHIYLSVPVHCLTVEAGSHSLSKDDAHGTVDILICRDTQAVLAIVLDAEQRKLENVFSGYLGCLPHYFLISDELTEEKLRTVADSVDAMLHRCVPQCTGCCLYAEPAADVIGRLHDGVIHAQTARLGLTGLLHSKHLICADQSVSHYGRLCSLFQAFLQENRRVLMCRSGCGEQLRKALRWTADPAPDTGLAQRLDRVKAGLPSRDGAFDRTATALRSLLDTPLENLFRNHPQEKSKVMALLSHGQLLSLGSAVTAFGDKEDITTYADLVYAVWNLREHTGQGDCRLQEAFGTCEEILWNLSVVLLSPDGEEKPSTHRHGRQTLAERMGQVRSKAEAYPLLSAPLSHYSYAGAALSDTEFPVYLYSRVLLPYLRFYGLADCSFRQALQFIHALRTSDDEVEVMDYSMLIFDLLVDTVSGAVV